MLLSLFYKWKTKADEAWNLFIYHWNLENFSSYLICVESVGNAVICIDHTKFVIK